MDNFKVIKKLGSGSSGIVYLVKSLGNGNLCAIKEMEYDSLEIQEKERIIQEIEIIRLCNHDNIIKIFSLTKCNGKIEILMEYADNNDLFDYVSKRTTPLPESEVVEIFTQICLAVKYLHDRKIIHRDIKLDNIFMFKNGLIKLGDFGFAKCLRSTIDKTKSTVGSPYYLSPEVCSGIPYSAPSDIWGLGCVLFIMCTLKFPFYGNTFPDIVRSILRCAPASIPHIYSNELRQLVTLMLQKQPEKRPTINEILQVPLLRYKAMELLGRSAFESEMSHTIFHGFAPGVTPNGFLNEIKIQLDN
ncbi:AGC family protein kinase [Histomonas meleagridis]|uniref:AGC family protein kinase n=1 Tax=Histomonas meleagridis TaxID=135588 RepID=UPI00355A1B59|nr:AGC family protein kinase [Histomonas meleagridis]KAH0797237.1 AGC family protein kinase [Histomonas meleagridis]